MPECRFCSAPVDRRQGFCRYCDSRLELDLHGDLAGRLYEPDSERTCPDCEISLDTVDLKIDKKFLVEKCRHCHGLFFDPGELQMILAKSVTNVYHIDRQKLDQLQNQSYRFRPKEFTYRKCPACQVVMNRVAFGYRSGVIVDHCNKHGFWLDEGELRQLQEWKKAGGEMEQKSKGKGYGHEPKAPLPEEANRPKKSADITFTTSSRRRDHFGTEDVFDLLTGIFS